MYGFILLVFTPNAEKYAKKFSTKYTRIQNHYENFEFENA